MLTFDYLLIFDGIDSHQMKNPIKIYFQRNSLICLMDVTRNNYSFEGRRSLSHLIYSTTLVRRPEQIPFDVEVKPSCSVIV